MRKALIGVTLVLFQCFVAAAQTPDRLEGRWAGSVEGLQGKQSAVATFKKDGDKYTGNISGLLPGSTAVLKDIKVDGDKVTAKTELETPQGGVVVTYAFVVQGDSLKGKGEAEFGGQTYGFDFDLKRGGAEPPAGQQAPPQQPRREVPQPQQKQSLTYFVGQWNFSWVGRESALGPAPREGTTTFTLLPDGKTLDARTEGKSDGKAYSETAAITLDEATKKMTYSERLANGVQVLSKGDWSSPISNSFTVTEELSEGGGPFVRLGSGIYSRAVPSK